MHMHALVNGGVEAETYGFDGEEPAPPAPEEPEAPQEDTFTNFVFESDFSGNSAYNGDQSHNCTLHSLVSLSFVKLTARPQYEILLWFAPSSIWVWHHVFGRKHARATGKSLVYNVLNLISLLNVTHFPLTLTLGFRSQHLRSQCR